jgi:integrase/recombinase XerD
MNDILDQLITTYYYRRNPKFISNDEIFEFFIKNRDKIGLEDFLEIRRYFNTTVNVYRKVFEVIAEWYADHEQDESVSIIDGKYKQKRIYPRMYNECRDAMRLKRYSPKTIKIYLTALCTINDWCLENKHALVDDLDGNALRGFFKYLTDEKKSSLSTMRIHRFAVSYYFRQILKKDVDLAYVEGLRDSKHLPVVMSRDEVRKILGAIDNLKHRTMLALIYSSGLRLSELITLKVKDINLDDLTIHVREGKGRKDRITIFSEKIKDDVERFMKNKQQGEYLFLSSVKDDYGRHRRLSGRTVQKVLENAQKRAGIMKKATPHDLRHSFATHLLENGVSIAHIQKLLGHKNISTTTIYAKVSNPQLKGIRSPL